MKLFIGYIRTNLAACELVGLNYHDIMNQEKDFELHEVDTYAHIEELGLSEEKNLEWARDTLKFTNVWKNECRRICQGIADAAGFHRIEDVGWTKALEILKKVRLQSEN